MLRITSFKANCGDSFLIEDLDGNKKILLDCGFKLTYHHEIRKLVSSVDFLILTHSDEDHIHGAIPLLQDHPDKFTVGKVYTNIAGTYHAGSPSVDISIQQAITLENIITEKGVSCQKLLAGDVFVASKNITLEVISPFAEDLEFYLKEFNKARRVSSSEPITKINKVESFENLAKEKDKFKSKKEDFSNTASIAFILDYKGKKILFLGDSHPSVIADYFESKGFSETNKYTFNYVKLSHHGSITSISKKLISMISCSKYIISTNGGKSRSSHPSRETLAKLAFYVDRDSSSHLDFFFNYPIETIVNRNGVIVSDDEKEKYNLKLTEQSVFCLT